MDTIDNIESPQRVEEWRVLSKEQTNKKNRNKAGLLLQDQPYKNGSSLNG